MDLKKLNAININNPAEIKELQQFLKSRGYYNGPIDGKWGGGTTEGAVKLRADLVAEDTRATARADAEARGKEAENDPTARVTKLATEVGPYAVGAGAGYMLSRGMKRRFDTKDAAAATSVSRLARDRALNPAIAEQELNRLNRARMTRSGKQFMVPAALAGAGELTRRYLAPNFEDKQTRDAINLVATGEQAAATTLAAKQLYDVATRGSPNDPVDVATIRSRAAAPPQNALDAAGRQALPPSDETPAPRPNSARLIAAARAAGARGPLTKQAAADYLAARGNVTPANRAAVAAELGAQPGERVGSVVRRLASTRGASSIALPLIAGGLAYELAGEPAEAADGSGAVATPANRLAAAGTAAGTAYGINKLAQALPAAANTAFSAVSRMSPISMIDDMTNFVPISEEENARAQGAENQTMNALARAMPQSLQFGPIRRASEMSQVPERNPMFHEVPDAPPNALAVAGDQPDAFGAALADFMALLRDGGFGETEVMR
jgi:hypothetical protein